MGFPLRNLNPCGDCTFTFHELLAGRDALVGTNNDCLFCLDRGVLCSIANHPHFGNICSAPLPICPFIISIIPFFQLSFQLLPFFHLSFVSNNNEIIHFKWFSQHQQARMFVCEHVWCQMWENAACTMNKFISIFESKIKLSVGQISLIGLIKFKTQIFYNFIETICLIK